MDRTRLAIESETTPVPKLECEDIRRGAHLKHHALCPGAMNGTGWNKKMIVLQRWPAIYVLLGWKRSTILLRMIKIIYHFSRRYIVLQAEIDSRLWTSV